MELLVLFAEKSIERDNSLNRNRLLDWRRRRGLDIERYIGSLDATFRGRKNHSNKIPDSG